MDFKTMREQIIGKKLLSVVSLDLKEEGMKEALKRLTNNKYEEIDNAHILLFEDKKAIVFVDFDSDGYRSGDWNILFLTDVLDKGYTQGIKAINSTVKEVEYHDKITRLDQSYGDPESEALLIVTDEYMIMMGKDYSDSYYPRNFLDIEEAKKYILGKGELVTLP